MEIKKFFFETNQEELIFRDAIIEMIDFCEDKNMHDTASSYEQLMKSLSAHKYILLSDSNRECVIKALTETLTSYIHRTTCDKMLDRISMQTKERR